MTKRELNESTIKSFLNESHEEELEINGSGLFHFQSSVEDTTKLKIVRWYKNLSPEERKYVDILRSEASDDAEFFSQGD